MNRGAEIVLRAAAILLSVAMFLPAAVRGGRGSGAGAAPAAARSFHGGKSAASAAVDAGCISSKCHRTGVHVRERSEAAFLNMHEGFVRCLACHGKDAERRWKAAGASEGEGNFRLAYASAQGTADPHGSRGEALRCVRCHSPEGRKALVSAGLSGLNEGFASPIAIRMMEGTGRKWVPQDLR